MEEEGGGEGIEGAVSPAGGGGCLAGGLGGGEAFIGGADGHADGLAQLGGEGLGGARLGAVGAGEGEGEADDDLGDSFGLDEVGDGSDGVALVPSGDGRAGMGEHAEVVGEGDADARFAGVEGEDAARRGGLVVVHSRSMVAVSEPSVPGEAASSTSSRNPKRGRKGAQPGTMRTSAS